MCASPAVHSFYASLFLKHELLSQCVLCSLCSYTRNLENCFHSVRDADFCIQICQSSFCFTLNSNLFKDINCFSLVFKILSLFNSS